MPAAAPAMSSSQPAAVVATAVTTSARRGGVAVQVGSFRKQQDAEGLIQRLRKKGYPGMVQEVALPGSGTWYRAMVGPYADRRAAEPVAQRLRSEEKMAVLVKQL
mgnify:FL=1